ncbi:hypothetical protein STAQ_40400 [Allostella sp. ATCC 35155]|nr:hypothetical protein STAQ_40400 [Stella sp. ATCC 35155]
MGKKRRASGDPKVRATAARFYVELVDELRRVYERESARGLSKAELARLLGVHRSVVARMLSGENGNITAGSVGALAGAMNHYPVLMLRPYDTEPGNRPPTVSAPERGSGMVFTLGHGNGDAEVPGGSSVGTLRREEHAA